MQIFPFITSQYNKKVNEIKNMMLKATKQVTKIRKRDGRIVDFDSERIVHAVRKAGEATGEFGEETARQLTLRVLGIAQETIDGDVPTVEQIQDIVEEVLLASTYRKTAKGYILYRDQHTKMREIATKDSVKVASKSVAKDAAKQAAKTTAKEPAKKAAKLTAKK